MTGDGGRPARRRCVRPEPPESTCSSARSPCRLAASAASVWGLQTHQQMRHRSTLHPRCKVYLMKLSRDVLAGLLKAPVLPPDPLRFFEPHEALVPAGLGATRQV